MNKIHNNLIIENLIKTEDFKQLNKEKKEAIVKKSEWFNQFDKNQKEQILKGLKNNIDISVYAKPEYKWDQMVEIKWGLEENLDVSWYTNKDLTSFQMEEIR